MLVVQVVVGLINLLALEFEAARQHGPSQIRAQNLTQDPKRGALLGASQGRGVIVLGWSLRATI